MCAIRAAGLPSLVISPACMVIPWTREIERWRPTMRRQFRVISYSNLKELRSVDPAGFRTIILDEAHYVKNPKAGRTRLACRLARRIGEHGRVMALTGTLVPNRPIELWPLLYTLRITSLNWWRFAMRYASAFESPWGGLDVRGASNLVELRELIGRHALRYVKEDVLPTLPEKTWRVIALDLPVPRQKKRFDLEDMSPLKLRVAFEALSEVLHAHGVRKVPLALDHVSSLLESVSKVVVFARHQEVMDMLEEGLSWAGVARVDGSMTPRRRQRSIDEFQEGEPRVFLGQIEAAGVGITLTAATHVVFVEASWTPAVLEQASDRAHRIGTSENVTVDLLTIHRSIDEYVLRGVLKKIEVIDQIVPKSHFTGTPGRGRVPGSKRGS